METLLCSFIYSSYINWASITGQALFYVLVYCCKEDRQDFWLQGSYILVVAPDNKQLNK